MNRFDELPLHSQVMAGVQHAGFTELTEVQQQALPIALQGQDVAVQAQTGTGKTAAFLITLYQRLLETAPPASGNPRALIIAPTRELVVQIYEDAQALGLDGDLRLAAIFGGMGYQEQRQQLQTGTDVVIATPGRLIDYLKQRVFSLKQAELLVIDEADRMFDMGFVQDLRYILRRLPSYEQRQSLLFSATLSPRVTELAYEFMNAPQRIRVAPQQKTASEIEEEVCYLAAKEKLPFLLGLLTHKQPQRVLVFSNTKHQAHHLKELLQANDWSVALLSGDLSQKRRMSILERFKQGQVRVLVATDVAARGIHIPEVDYVVNYELPQDPEDYVHRVGRTGRAGAAGKALSLVDEDWALNLLAIEEYLCTKIPSRIPEEGDFLWEYERPAKKRRAPGGQKPRSTSGKRRSAGQKQGAGAPEKTEGKQGSRRPRRRRRNNKPQANAKDNQDGRNTTD